MTYGDIWWPLMAFDDFSWQNHVVYHDMSWYIMICHDISPTNSERYPVLLEHVNNIHNIRLMILPGGLTSTSNCFIKMPQLLGIPIFYDISCLTQLARCCCAHTSRALRTHATNGANAHAHFSLFSKYVFWSLVM